MMTSGEDAGEQRKFETAMGKWAELYTEGKGKAIPLQPWTGPEGPRTLRLPDFKTIGT